MQTVSVNPYSLFPTSMAVSFFPAILLLLLALLRLIFSSAAQSSSPPPSVLQQTQFKNIVDALISSGDFAGWVNLLSSTDPSTLPLTATLFIPTNDAVSRFPFSSATAIDPLLVPYHIVPQRLTFSDLRQFAVHTRLPTFLPARYIVITNNSPSNFTIDDSQITQPDVFVNAAFSVHGIQKVLDYSVYGNTDGFLPLVPANPEPRTPPISRPMPKLPRNGRPAVSGEIPGKTSAGIRPGDPSLCTEIFILSFPVFVLFWH